MEDLIIGIATLEKASSQDCTCDGTPMCKSCLAKKYLETLNRITQRGYSVIINEDFKALEKTVTQRWCNK